MRAVLTVIGLSLGQAAVAYTSPPAVSFAKPTADGRHVLVVLRKPYYRGFKNPVEEKYARSGLYAAADPNTPLWTFDSSADRVWSVAVANDGVHAARVPDGDPAERRWVLGTASAVPQKPADLAAKPAVWVYKSGHLIRTVTVGELFDCATLTDRDR